MGRKQEWQKFSFLHSPETWLNAVLLADLLFHSPHAWDIPSPTSFLDRYKHILESLHHINDEKDEQLASCGTICPWWSKITCEVTLRFGGTIQAGLFCSEFFKTFRYRHSHSAWLWKRGWFLARVLSLCKLKEFAAVPFFTECQQNV